MNIDFSFVAADLETNGLYNPNKIFMMGVQDLMTGNYKSFVGIEQVAEAIFTMSNVSKVVVGHHFLGYDAKVIKDITGVEISKDVIVDTLQMSKDFCKMSKHGLGVWGEILGLPKLKQPLFEEYSEEMDTYCERDVRLNSAVFALLYRMYLHARPNKMGSYAAVLHRNEEALRKNFLM